MKRPCSPAPRLASMTLALLVATSFVGGGCGGSMTPYATADSKAPGMSEPAPQNLGEAEAQLSTAEQRILGSFGQYKPELQGGFAQPPGQATNQQGATPSATAEAAPPPPPQDKDHMAKEGEARLAAPTTAGADAASSSTSPCETACRALASMNRAMTHICVLAGDESENCTNARERVRAATERVRQSCPECSG